MGKGTRFKPLIPDPCKSNGAKRVILCSGRVYYDLDAARRERNVADVALIRIEELYPFPGRALSEAMKVHNCAELTWCQEEPQNMGAWGFVERRIVNVLNELDRRNVSVRYVGRPANSSPAPGFKGHYERQQRHLIEAALGA